MVHVLFVGVFLCFIHFVPCQAKTSTHTLCPPPPPLSRQVLALYPEIFLKEAYTREHYRWAHAILDSRRIWWNGEGSLVPMLDLVNCAEGPDSTRVHSTWLDEETQSYAVTKGKGVVLLFEGSTFGSTSVLHLYSPWFSFNGILSFQQQQQQVHGTSKKGNNCLNHMANQITFILRTMGFYLTTTRMIV